MNLAAYSPVCDNAAFTGGDMARRRLQQKGDLYAQSGWWKLRWMEDQVGMSGAGRGWSKPVWIGPSEGVGKLSKREARRIAWDNFLSKIDANNHTPMTAVTLAEFVDRKFIPEHVSTLKKSGRVHYNSMFKHILPALGALKLRDIGVSEVQHLVSGLRVKERRARLASGAAFTRPASTQTCKHVRNVLSAVFEHAISIEWMTSRNPARAIKLPKMTRKPTHALTAEQARALIAALNSPAREMVLCAVLTSMNIAEICGLQWRHVNLTDKWATVNGEAIPPRSLIVLQQWYLREYTTTKETTRMRAIPLAPPLYAALAEMQQRDAYTGALDPVFAARNGHPRDEHNVMGDHIKPIAAALGMPWVSWHVFRRTTATLADQAGMGTSDRKGLLGHGSSEMAMHYVQTADIERRRAALAGIAELLTPTQGVTLQ